MYGGLAFIMVMFLIHRVTNIKVQVVCDNKKYLLLSSKNLQRVLHQIKHADILRVICKV